RRAGNRPPGAGTVGGRLRSESDERSLWLLQRQSAVRRAARILQADDRGRPALESAPVAPYGFFVFGGPTATSNLSFIVKCGDGAVGSSSRNISPRSRPSAIVILT